MKPLIGAGGRDPRAADSEEALTARLSTLAPALDGEPDPEWQSRTRTRLMAMAAVRTPQPEPASAIRRLLTRREGPRSLLRTRLTAGLAGAAAAVMGVATVVTLSADAKPGDALYGLKRGTEETQLAVAGDGRGHTLLGFASTRLDELSVVLTDEPSTDLVADTLATMNTQTADGAAFLAERALETGDLGPLDELAGWSAGQAAGLDGLQSGIPSSAQDVVAASAALLERIIDRVDDLRDALDCPAGPAIEGADDLGPVPGECAPPPPTAGGVEPGAPLPDLPVTTALPTPGSPPVATTAPGSDTVSGGSSDGSSDGSSGGTSDGSSGGTSDGSSGGTSDGSSGSTGGSESPSGSETGSTDPGLPSTPGPSDLPTPTVPPPTVPTVLPDPDGGTLPPTPGGSAGVSADAPVLGSAAGSSAPAAPTITAPDLDVCPSPLPVTGDC